jgi:hypothetical protein
VRIERHNDRALYLAMLTAFTAAFVFFMYIFVRPFFHGAGVKDLVLVSPFIAFVLLWYVLGLRFAVWRAFGVEEIIIESGRLRWIRTALLWSRELDIPATDITEIKAVTPWHALSNRVEFTARGWHHTIGDMLLRDEANELAHELRHRISLAG